MEKQPRSRRNFIQNILITVLTISGVLLFAQSQLYTMGITMGSDYLKSFTGGAAADSLLSDHTLPLASPVQVAVTGTYGRHGKLTMTTADPDFEPLASLLGEVLGSARSFSPSTEKAFLKALSAGSSVYYDFGVTLPLSVLSALVGTELEENDTPARRLLVADLAGDEVALFLWDDRGAVLQCRSAVSHHTLQDVVSRYELGDAHFAMDEALPDSEQLAPLTLILENADRAALPILTVSAAPANSDRLLTALNFNPRTNLRYPDADGTEVIVEGERTLRIRPDGEILYQSGGRPMVTLAGPDQTLSMRQTIAGSALLLTDLLAPQTGEASLSLRSIRQTEEQTVLEFDYHVDGIPVRFSDGKPAAVLTLRGNTVENLRLRLRQYTSSAQFSLLLPLRQAIAVAGLEENAELSIGYVDRGGDSVSAQWLSR